MTSKFKSPFYEILTVLFLVVYLFRSLSMLIHLGDIFALIPSAIELAVFVFLFMKSQHLAYSMKLWAVYLMVTAGIKLASKILLAVSRDTYAEGLEWKIMILVSGIIIWWIAAKKVDLVQENVEDSF